MATKKKTAPARSTKSTRARELPPVLFQIGESDEAAMKKGGATDEDIECFRRYGYNVTDAERAAYRRAAGA